MPQNQPDSPTTKEAKCSIFGVDYARQLANIIAVVNREYIDRLQALHPLSPTYREVLIEWRQAIDRSCHEMMSGMNDVVDYYLKVATDAVACSLPRPIIVGVDHGVGPGIAVRTKLDTLTGKIVEEEVI